MGGSRWTRPGTTGWVATEHSPFGVPLGVEYPHAGADALVAAATAAMPAWRDAGPDARAAVCVEILTRIHEHVFELANAVQFTTGQAFVMAFQAGGAHALDRALGGGGVRARRDEAPPGECRLGEAGRQGRAAADEQDVPRRAARHRPGDRLQHVPDVELVPGLVRLLATGNAVIVKPHPLAVLPLAITVQYAREVLAEAGFDAESGAARPEEPGREDRLDPGGPRRRSRSSTSPDPPQYGDWLERNARQASVYTEKAGVNTIVIDSTDDFAGMCRNIAFSLTLYSGQMCTTPQNILVPRDGIETESGHQSFDEVAGRDRRRGRRS